MILRRINAVRQLLEIAKVKRTLWIGAFVDFEVLASCSWEQECVRSMGKEAR